MFIALVAASLAAPPSTLRHQGRVVDSLGQPINDTVTVVVDLHSDATAEAEQWTEQHNDVIVADGYFSLELGSINGFSQGLFDQQLWIDVTVGSTHLTPRERVSAVPVALTTTIDPLASLCDRMEVVGPARTYTSLNSSLDANYFGASVCGTGRHVCNATEFATYSVVGQCDVGNGWLVGGFSNVEPHRRALWNYQDATQCTGGRYPAGYAIWEGIYAGRVHCQSASDQLPVLCCDNP